METTEQIAPVTGQLAGGWSPYHPLTESDKQVFDEAIAGFVGVTYIPQRVSTQVVAGTNYRYKCLGTLPNSDVAWEAIVQIYTPLDGKPFVTHIQPL